MGLVEPKAWPTAWPTYLNPGAEERTTSHGAGWEGSERDHDDCLNFDGLFVYWLKQQCVAKLLNKANVLG